MQLACPTDQGALRLAEDGAAYRCDSCETTYPVEDGVARFLPASDRFYEGCYL